MPKKRKSLKGKGADIFLTESQHDSTTAKHSDIAPSPSTKATFYLPKDLIEDLDLLYLNLRQEYRGLKIKKSQIVKISLKNLFDDHQKNKNNSVLSKHLDGILSK